MIQLYLVVLLSIEELIIALAYLLVKDYARFFYWMCATGITIGTIFIK